MVSGQRPGLAGADGCGFVLLGFIQGSMGAGAMSDEERALEQLADNVSQTLERGQGRRWAAMPGWGLVLLLCAGAAAWWWWPEDETTRWQLQALDRGDMRLTAVATGNLAAKSEVTVGAEISGLILTVDVSENDMITRGQVLARFDPEELEVALTQAEARLSSAQAAEQEALATQEEALLAERRLASLVAGQNASQEALDMARAARKRASARVQTSRAAIREAQASVLQARTRLGKSVITSPIHGVVLQRQVEPGNTVAANFQAPELFLLAEDLREMELHVAVDEADVGLVAAGQMAVFNVDAWPDRQFDAEVLSVYLYPNIENNVVTYTAVLGVDNSDELLRPGMTAMAIITTGEREGILRLPNQALRFTPPTDQVDSGLMMAPPGMRGSGRAAAGNAVWVLKAGAPMRVPVKTGYSDGQYTELLGGELAAGDQVLIGLQADAR